MRIPTASELVRFVSMCLCGCVWVSVCECHSLDREVVPSVVANLRQGRLSGYARRQVEWHYVPQTDDEALAAAAEKAGCRTFPMWACSFLPLALGTNRSVTSWFPGIAFSALGAAASCHLTLVPPTWYKWLDPVWCCPNQKR